MPRYTFLTEALHADWPAYPVGHGVDHALDTLCNLPPGARFAAIDDIDRCLLLLDMDHRAPGEADDCHTDHHHVAIWHEDLRALRDQGLAEGFCPAPTAEELCETWCDEAVNMSENLRGKALVRAAAHDWEAVVQEMVGKDEITMGSISTEGLAVTDKGWARHHERLAAFEVAPALATRTAPPGRPGLPRRRRA